jgi:hypothetical protein
MDVDQEDYMSKVRSGIFVLIVLILLALPSLALAYDDDIVATPGDRPVQVLAPLEGSRFTPVTHPRFTVTWERYSENPWMKDTLVAWYDVRFWQVKDGVRTGQSWAFRYAPDRSTDYQRRNPSIFVDTGILPAGFDYELVVIAYGAGEKLLTEFPKLGVRSMPTDRDLSYYVDLTPPSNPVRITIGFPFEQ